MIKLTDILKELKIQRPNKFWDLTIYDPNFDTKQIKVGDEIKLRKNHFSRFIDDIIRGSEEPNVTYPVEQIEKHGDFNPPQYIFTIGDKDFLNYHLIQINDENKQ